MDQKKTMRASCYRCHRGFDKPFGSPQALCSLCGGATYNCPTHGWYTIAPGVANSHCRRCNPQISHKPKQGPAKNPTNIGDPLDGRRKSK